MQNKFNWEYYGYDKPEDLTKITKQVVSKNVADKPYPHGKNRELQIHFEDIVTTPNGKIVKVKIIYSVEQTPPSLQTIIFKGEI